MNIEHHINELFRLLRSRPAMLMKGETHSYLNYVVFFEGFFLGQKLFNGMDMERKISVWYQDKVEFKAPNMYWFDQFETINKNESEKEKIVRLITCLESFFNDHYKYEEAD